jgi:hypothetical protein
MNFTNLVLILLIIYLIYRFKNSEKFTAPAPGPTCGEGVSTCIKQGDCTARDGYNRRCIDGCCNYTEICSGNGTCKNANGCADREGYFKRCVDNCCVYYQSF